MIVGVSVGVGSPGCNVLVGVGVWVSVGVAEGVNVAVGVGVAVSVGVGVSVGVDVDVAVDVKVGVRVSVGGLTIIATCSVPVARAGPSRVIPRIKPTTTIMPRLICQ